MRRFNPEKELSKIKNGNKKKVICSIFIILIVSIISYSFALYQVRHSKKLVYTTVKDFSKDVNLAVFINNEKVDEFPNKNENYIYDKIVCDNNKDNHVTAYWNYDKWALELETSKKAKCNVYFKSGTDKSGANPPELYQGLIPITIEDDGTIKVANLGKEWYNYNEREWANAVLVTNEAYKRIVKEDGTYDITQNINLENDILQMYVWIPRYKYELFNADNESVDPQMINVKFESGIETTGTVKCITASNGMELCKKDINGNWYTHPAFTFGDTELPGIWVGKFETSGSTDLKIIPNANALLNLTIKYMFDTVRSIDVENNKYNLKYNDIDTHMMKNIEWGAVAYLSHSIYGTCNNNKCEKIANNINSNYLTGFAGEDEMWDSTNGVKASTTGNIYGIYDMSGGAWEYVMANMTDELGVYSPGSSELNSITDVKYYDAYEYSSDGVDNTRGHLGDATREVIKGYDPEASRSVVWYDGYALLLSRGTSWMLRGGYLASSKWDNLFAFSRANGGNRANTSFRVVLTAQDGTN